MSELIPPPGPPAEQPTEAARLRIIVEPVELAELVVQLPEQPTTHARLRFSSQPIELTVEDFPPKEAHTLIATGGMIALGLAGITGANLVERAAPSPILGWILALAELALTLVVVLLIARRDGAAPRRG